MEEAPARLRTAFEEHCIASVVTSCCCVFVVFLAAVRRLVVGGHFGATQSSSFPLPASRSKHDVTHVKVLKFNHLTKCCDDVTNASFDVDDLIFELEDFFSGGGGGAPIGGGGGGGAGAAAVDGGKAVQSFVFSCRESPEIHKCA